MKQVVIVGASGLGQLVHDILLHDPSVSVAGFLDSNPTLHGTTVDGKRVWGGLEQIQRLRWQGLTHAVVAIGINPTRRAMAERLEAEGLQLYSAIHPQAALARSVRLGRHVIIGAGVRVCVHATIADHVVLSAGSIVEHDNVVEAGAFLHPAVRLAGGVSIGADAVLEIGASVIPGVSIGAGARVGAGSIVIRDIAPTEQAAGVPARSKAAVAARQA